MNLYTKFKVSILNGCGIVEIKISLKKNLETKKKDQIQGRTNRKMPICNPTIQLVVANPYTKFEISILNGCGDIFDKKSGEAEKRTNIGKNK